MGEYWFLGNIWYVIAACEILYVMDYCLGNIETQMYLTSASRYFQIDNIYEQDPYLNRATGKISWVNWRIIIILLLLAGGLYAVWHLSVGKYAEPRIFSILAGGIILLKAASLVRRLRYLSLFQYLGKHGGLEGNLKISRGLFLTAGYTELYGFSLLYLLSFLITGSWFFTGGGFTCFISARRRRDYTLISRYTAG
jgi:hypothetical protein